MNLGQNKFLVGLIAVVLIGSLALGVLGWRAASSFGELSAQLETSKAEFKRLQSLPLYPEAANLKKLEEQKTMVGEAAASLQQQLLPLAYPLERITPEQFQDKLRATVSAVSKKANEAHVKLPDKFYLGFDQYQSAPPKSEASAALDRQLKAIHLAVDTLISSGVNTITGITRVALPEEGDASRIKAGALVSKYPFEVQFVAEQLRFRRVLNELARNNKQFFIVQPVSIKTENDKPLSKAESAPAGSGTGSDPAEPGGSLPQKSEGQLLRYLVGTETIAVTLRIDMVVFAAPPSTGSSPK